MRWLAIEVHFLAGRYHGRGDDGRVAEWPPNPHRLFQARARGKERIFLRTPDNALLRAREIAIVRVVP